MYLMKQPEKWLVLFLAALLIFALPASAAPPEGKGKGNPHNQQKQGKAAKNDHGPGKKHDRNHDRDTADALISAAIGFDAARRIALDNRYTGYSALPPGIRKNLARGKPIPPGIARRAVPGPMLAKLPRYPGYEWAVYGSDLVLVATATAVIADVLFDVFD
jgi:Ni/Co efflux regulator RcnB